MVDQERPQDDKERPIEQGDGVADAEPKPEVDSTPERERWWLRQLLSEGLEQMGMGVFAVTAVGTLIFVFWFNLSSEFQPLVTLRQIRSTELMLTLVATSLVIAIIGRAQSPFVLAFGIFLIGALIVPSSDIVRFALVASGSGRDLSFLEEVSSGSGADLSGRSTDVASKIITELERFGFVQNVSDVDRRKLATNIVAEEIRDERVLTLFEQVRVRGALETLGATNDGDLLDEWILRYEEEPKFLDDLRFLRSEDLVSFVFDDLQTIKTTELGKAVLDRADTAAEELRLDQPTEPSVADQQESSDQQLAVYSGSFASSCPVSGESVVTDLTRQNVVAGVIPVSVGERGAFFSVFEIAVSGNYTVELSATSGFVDAFISLYRLIGDECELLGQDDDGGPGLDSKLAQDFESGTYLLEHRNLDSFRGQAELRISKN